jgi:hypothetical protein
MSTHLPSPDRRRRRVITQAGALAAALLVLPARPQEVPRLRPSEVIEVAGGSVTVLGVDVLKGDSTRITLRLRATAGEKQPLHIDLDAFRVIAGGVPRAPDSESNTSVLVAKESANDFSRVFTIPDRTDDLVLQIRVGDSVARRRLSGN